MQVYRRKSCANVGQTTDHDLHSSVQKQPEHGSQTALSRRLELRTALSVRRFLGIVLTPREPPKSGPRTQSRPVSPNSHHS